MVDHEIITREHFFIPEVECLPLEYFHFKRRYSEGEELNRISRVHDTPATEFLRSFSVCDVKPVAIEKWDNALICEKLSHISNELLSRSPEKYESIPSAQEIKALEMAYKNGMELFLFKMDEFLTSVWKMRSKLIKSLKEFRFLSRSTAQIILASSITNFALVLGSYAQKIFRFSWNPKFFFLSSVTGALSFATSLLTVSYMKRTTNEFLMDMHKERLLLLDLIRAHSKGDWIDGEVSRLFPFGINLNLIDKTALEDGSYFKTKYSWRRYLCATIILHNIQKDVKLLNNEDFLTRVKLFVENPAAEVWWSRLKIKILLGEVRQNVDDTSVKKLLSCHEDLTYRTALYAYPVIIPWLVSSRTTEQMKFISSSLAGILAASHLGNDGSEELQKLKKMYLSFQKGFKEIRKICEILDHDEY